MFYKMILHVLVILVTKHHWKKNMEGTEKEKGVSKEPQELHES